MFGICVILPLLVVISHGQFLPLKDALDSTGINNLINTIEAAGDDFATTTANLKLDLAKAIGLTDNTTISPAIADVANTLLNEYNDGLHNEDVTLSMGELLDKYGYPYESHQVETDDGYILRMFRIPGSGPTVFLMHGLTGASDDFIVMGPENSLAYILAREGYDVWLGNARGNKHSLNHITLDRNDKKFWDFSWHEIGYYDLPALIDYALANSNATRLKYIGHSQGTTTFFVMASERPEYNRKISIMVSLSPVAYMAHTKSPLLKLLVWESPIAKTIWNDAGSYEIAPATALTKATRILVCDSSVLSEVLCYNNIFLLMGFDYENLNFTVLPVLLAHASAGASVKQLLHYAQSIQTGEFRQYDYGPAKNLERYGAKEPPGYNLEAISAPVSLHYSEGDWLANPTDVVKLSNRLSKVVDMYKIPFDHFSHIDFISAKHAKELLYDRIVDKLLKSFN